MIDSKNYENLQLHRSVYALRALPESFPIHWHKYAEMVAFPPEAEAGHKPILCIQQEIYEISPGDLLWIWPGELHEIRSNEGRALVGLQFDPSIVNELPEFSPYIGRFRTFRHIRHEDVPELSENLMLQVKQIFSLNLAGSRFCGIESLICLLEMLMEFGGYLEREGSRNTQKQTRGANLLAEKMTAACSYITENCERELSLDSIADFVGFSACYFSRAFKQMTNYSFVEYLAMQRVKRAKTYLSDSEQPISEIAQQSGFQSISTFNRVFKQYEGCSPSEYRRYYMV